MVMVDTTSNLDTGIVHPKIHHICALGLYTSKFTTLGGTSTFTTLPLKVVNPAVAPIRVESRFTTFLLKVVNSAVAPQAPPQGGCLLDSPHCL